MAFNCACYLQCHIFMRVMPQIIMHFHLLSLQITFFSLRWIMQTQIILNTLFPKISQSICFCLLTKTSLEPYMKCTKSRMCYFWNNRIWITKNHYLDSKEKFATWKSKSMSCFFTIRISNENTLTYMYMNPRVLTIKNYIILIMHSV